MVTSIFTNSTQLHCAVGVGVVVDVGVGSGVGVGVVPLQFPPTVVTTPTVLIWKEYASPTPPSFNAIQLLLPLVGEDGYES